jgi:hypothetical protein
LFYVSGFQPVIRHKEDKNKKSPGDLDDARAYVYYEKYIPINTSRA